ncbi:MAG: hypothetical protein Q8N99_00610 [Nanoarchaeota archaeon]|nr:hypothetical protein [Nanoarchaeota archaeon]
METKNRTEKYQTTLADWIPGLGIYREARRISRGEPSIQSTNSLYSLMHSLAQTIPLAYAMAEGIEALIK